MNEELQKYIEGQLTAGVSKEKIIEVLSEQGWKKEDISNVFVHIEGSAVITEGENIQNPIQTNRAEIEVKDSSKGAQKTIIITMVVLIILIVGIFAVYTASSSGDRNSEQEKVVLNDSLKGDIAELDYKTAFPEEYLTYKLNIQSENIEECTTFGCTEYFEFEYRERTTKNDIGGFVTRDGDLKQMKEKMLGEEYLSKEVVLNGGVTGEQVNDGGDNWLILKYGEYELFFGCRYDGCQSDLIDFANYIIANQSENKNSNEANKESETISLKIDSKEDVAMGENTKIFNEDSMESKVIILRMVQPDGSGSLVRFATIGSSARMDHNESVFGYSMGSGSGDFAIEKFDAIEDSLGQTNFSKGEPVNDKNAWYQVIAAQKGLVLKSLSCNFPTAESWNIPPQKPETDCQNEMMVFISAISDEYDFFGGMENPDGAREKMDAVHPKDLESLSKIDLHQNLPEEYIKGVFY